MPRMQGLKKEGKTEKNNINCDFFGSMSLLQSTEKLRKAIIFDGEILTVINISSHNANTVTCHIF